MTEPKVSSTLLDSSIMEQNVATRFLWVGLLLLADEEGAVDMTPEAIARRTRLPLRDVRDGLTKFENPDPDSRTTEHEGRRLLRLVEGRSWGWQVINFPKYQAAARQTTTASRREYQRQYYEKKVKPKRRPSTQDSTPSTVENVDSTASTVENVDSTASTSSTPLKSASSSASASYDDEERSLPSSSEELELSAALGTACARGEPEPDRRYASDIWRVFAELCPASNPSERPPSPRELAAIRDWSAAGISAEQVEQVIRYKVEQRGASPAVLYWFRDAVLEARGAVHDDREADDEDLEVDRRALLLRLNRMELPEAESASLAAAIEAASDAEQLAVILDQLSEIAFAERSEE